MTYRLTNIHGWPRNDDSQLTLAELLVIVVLVAVVAVALLAASWAHGPPAQGGQVEAQGSRAPNGAQWEEFLDAEAKVIEANNP